MKITLITPTPPDISAFGVRALSAHLKQKGFETACLFLPGGIERLQHGGKYRYTYSKSALQGVLECVEGSDVVGISLMSQYRDRAIQLTEAVRKASDALIVWGGIHPEANPEDALQFADACAICEAEIVLEILLTRLGNNDSIDNIPGLITRGNSTTACCSGLPIIADLDTLPFIDMGPDNHFILDPIEDRVRDLTPEFLSRILPLMEGPEKSILKVYRTMSSRGCPHHCTYCANQVKAEKYTSRKYLRFRSPDHVLSELKKVTAQYPFIQGIHFFDDVFTAMPSNDLETLCRRYKEEIGLPYYAQASPSKLTEKQMNLFLETGLVFMELGVQTGSESIRRMYKRPETNEQVLNAARIIHQFRDRLIKPHYHVILDNPWESRDDVRATLDLLTRIPGKFMLCLASLTFYPGTDLYTQAKAENLIQDEEREIYQKPFFIPKGRYLNYLIYLTDIAWIPRGLLRWLGGVPALLLDRPIFGPLFDLARRVTDKARLAGKGAGAIFKGEFFRIFRYFKRVK